MLKIKDSVDLKELEKFGFTADFIGKNIRYEYNKNIGKNQLYNLKIDNETIIHINILSIYNVLDNVLYNLIQAGLVEKVEG